MNYNKRSNDILLNEVPAPIMSASETICSDKFDSKKEEMYLDNEEKAILEIE